MSKLNMLKMQHQKEVYTFSDKRIAILCASAISDNGLYRFYNEIVQRVKFQIKFYTSISIFRYLISIDNKLLIKIGKFMFEMMSRNKIHQIRKVLNNGLC